MLDIKEVKHIAALARIGVTEKDVKKYQKDLSAVLEYFNKLEEVVTDGVEPIGHITGRSNMMREDRINDPDALTREAILMAAPETKDGSIKVKSIL